MNQTEPPIFETLSSLENLKNAIGHIMESSEPKFVHLGETLQTVYTDADALSSKAIHSTEDMAKEQDGGIEAIVKTSIQDLKSCRGAVEKHLKRASVTGGSLGKLQNVSGLITGNARYLNIVGMNIMIESSRSTKATALFSDFGDEIKKLAADISKISRQILEDALLAYQQQQSTYDEIVTGLTQLKDLSDTSEEAVRVSTAEIRSLLELAARMFENTGRHSREIFNQVGEIVMAIQFHDIIRQQIEHVVSAFDDVSELLAVKPSETSLTEEEMGPGPSELGKAHSILYLQFKQMKFIISEVEEAYEKIQASFGRIGDEVGKLAGHTEGYDTKYNGKGAVDNQFQELTRGLANLRELLLKSNELGNRMDESMEQASHTVEKLSDFAAGVTDVSNNLKLKALNATIMTSNLGDEGKTLAVLADEVGEVSDRSTHSAADVMKILEEISSREAEPGMPGEGRSEPGMPKEGRSNGERMLDSLDSGIERINEAFQRYQEDSASIEQGANLLQKDIEKISSSLDFFPELIACFTAENKKLWETIQKLEPWAGIAQDDLSIDGDKALDRYTMESERMIHRQAMREKKQAATREEAKDVAAEDQDNVELFGDDDEGNVELFGDDDQGNVELFGDDDEGNVELFGDDDEGNVELFGDDDRGNVELFGDDDRGNVELFGDDDRGNVELFGDDDEGNAELFGDDDQGNVELFGDDDQGNVELFEDETRNNTETATGKEQDKDDLSTPKNSEDDEKFGDNIELF